MKEFMILVLANILGISIALVILFIGKKFIFNKSK